MLVVVALISALLHLYLLFMYMVIDSGAEREEKRRGESRGGQERREDARKGGEQRR